MAECDTSAPMSEDMRDWQSMPPVGSEWGANRKAQDGALEKLSQFDVDLLPEEQDDQEKADRDSQQSSKTTVIIEATCCKNALDQAFHSSSLATLQCPLGIEQISATEKKEFNESRTEAMPVLLR